MIRPAVGFVGGDPAAGPGLTRVMGDEACLTAIFTQAATPPPSEAVLTTIFTQRNLGDDAVLTAIFQEQDQLAIRVSNSANVPSAMGNPVTHEESSF